MRVAAADVVAGVSAGAEWSRNREFADPVAWADLKQSPAATAHVIGSRVSREPYHWTHMRVPKDSGGQNRPFWVTDPYEELILRLAIGASATRIARATGPEVLSYRLLSSGPGWETEEYHYPHSLGSKMARSHAESSAFLSLGRFDVRNYFPSTQVEAISQRLTELRIDGPDREILVGRLRQLHDVCGVQGIPTGPEASGLLGNLALLPVDGVLRSAGFTFTRYTDDYQFYLEVGQRFESAWSIVVRELRELGYEVNEDKVENITTRRGVRLVLEDSRIARIKDVRDAAPGRAIRMAQELLKDESRRRLDGAPLGRNHGRRVRYAVRTLREAGNAHGLRVLEDDPGILTQSGHTWIPYLRDLWQRRVLSDSAYAAILTASLHDSPYASFVALSIPVTGRRIPTHLGQRIGELVTDSSQKAPVKVAAAEAWAHSVGWKPALAVRAASESSNPGIQRACVLSMRGRFDRRSLRKARGISQEAAIAADWVRAIS